MADNNQSFFQQLLERRVFQIVGSYLIGAWAFIQFIDWIVDRYGIASGWTEFVIVFLIALIPSIIMLTWYHGRPGPDQWRKIEKVFIPINVIMAGMVAYFAFPTHDLNAQTLTVTATTEEGDTIVREIPTLAFQERFAIFPFESKNIDKTSQWIQFAIPHLLNLKLEQDMRFTSISPFKLAEEAAQYGYDLKEGKIPTQSIYQSIAEDFYVDHYMISELEENDERLTLNYSLYTTSSGKLLKEGTINGDVYSITDAVSDGINESLLLKDAQTTSDMVNLSASSLITPDIAALEEFIKGYAEIRANRSSMAGLQMIEKSIELDENCAECYAKAGSFGMALKGLPYKNSMLEKAMSKSKGLPERQQFSIKYSYYAPEQAQKAISLSEMWKNLYPMDSEPYSNLMFFYKLSGRFQDAIDVGKEALENGHGGQIYLDVAEMLIVLEKIEESNALVKEFAKKYPRKAKMTSMIGYAYLYDGQKEKGIEFFENKQIMMPDDPKSYQDLAVAYGMVGKSEKVLETYQKGVEVSKNLQDSMQLYQFLELSYLKLGQSSKAIEIYEENKKKLEGKRAPLSIAAGDLMLPHIMYYSSVGRENEIKARLIDFAKTYSSEAYDFNCAAKLNYFIAIQEGDSILQLLNICEEKVRATDGQRVIDLSYGVAYLGQKKYEQAIEYLDKYVESTGVPKMHFTPYYGEAYLNLGKVGEAEELVQKAINFSDADPGNLFLMAKINKKKGDTKQAREYAEKALNFWKDAEPEFSQKNELDQFISEL